MLELKIINFETLLFKDVVKQIDLPGVNGKFQVLKNHAKIMSILQAGVVKIIDEADKKIEIKVEYGGVIDVNNNTVKILIF